MTEGVPLCIPEVNAAAVDSITLGEGGIVANPNCSTIIALMAVTPLHRKASVQRMVVSTYQVGLCFFPFPSAWCWTCPADGDVCSRAQPGHLTGLVK